MKRLLLLALGLGLLLLANPGDSVTIQYARPIFTYAWGITWDPVGEDDHYKCVDEVVMDGDATYVDGKGPGAEGTAWGVKLGAISPSSPSSCVLHYMFRTIGRKAPEKVNIFLIEDHPGSPKTIGAWKRRTNRSSGYVNGAGSFDCSAVTDWSDLYVLSGGNTIGNNEHVRVTQIYLTAG